MVTQKWIDEKLKKIERELAEEIDHELKRMESVNAEIRVQRLADAKGQVMRRLLSELLEFQRHFKAEEQNGVDIDCGGNLSEYRKLTEVMREAQRTIKILKGDVTDIKGRLDRIEGKLKRK